MWAPEAHIGSYATRAPTFFGRRGKAAVDQLKSDRLLVIIIPNVDRELQRRLFNGAIDQLVLRGEPVNQALEVDLDGEDVTFTLYDLPVND